MPTLAVFLVGTFEPAEIPWRMPAEWSLTHTRNHILISNWGPWQPS